MVIRSAPVLVSFAVLPDGYTREGRYCAELVRRMADSGVVDAVGLNCVSKILCAQQRKPLCHGKIYLPRRGILGVRGGAKVRKHCGAGLPGGAGCQLQDEIL